jgi:ribose/xylose/arabinose/galactoside ABC-type transport system permease subunit
MFAVVALICAGLFFSSHEFFNLSNTGNLVRNISMLDIFAVGIAFVIITGGIDLSLGTLFGVAIGCTMYKVIYNGIIMFQWVYHVGSRKQMWHIPTEWTEWIIGGVLLIAVALDQIAHIVQARRRTRKVVLAQPAAPAVAVALTQ